MFQAASELSYVEALLLLHGDIELSDIMVENHERKPLRNKLIDFSLAHQSLASPTSCCDDWPSPSPAS